MMLKACIVPKALVELCGGEKNSKALAQVGNEPSA
jgi:hypothetical protein